jgi:hypothetical protein
MVPSINFSSRTVLKKGYSLDISKKEFLKIQVKIAMTIVQVSQKLTKMSLNILSINQIQKPGLAR